MNDQVKPVVEKIGINESLELLEGFKIMGCGVMEALKDGKLGWSDLKILVDLGKNFSDLIAAFKGISDIPSEIKDIDGEEAKQLIAKMGEVFKAIVDVKKVQDEAVEQ